MSGSSRRGTGRTTARPASRQSISDTPHPDAGDILDRVELFAHLSEAGRRHVADTLAQRVLPAGQELFHYGDTGDSLYVVADGDLEVVVEDGAGGGRVLGHIDSHHCVGEMALLAPNSRRTATVRAVSDAMLLELPRRDFERLLAEEPSLRKVVAQVLMKRLPGLHLATSRLFGDLDQALLDELHAHFFWVNLARGEALFREGEAAEAVYYVINGRIQVSALDQGRPVALEQVGGGHVVGELAMITGDPHTMSAVALRDSDLIGLSRVGFEQILERNPRAAAYVVRGMLKELGGRPGHGGGGRDSPLRTIAVVPLAPAAAGFGRRLARGLKASGKTLYLNARAFDRFHSAGAAHLPDDDPRALYLRKWFSQQEESRAHVVYEADPEDTPWTRRCLRQADRILLVGPAAASPRLRVVEELAGRLAPGVPAELVLTHEGGDRLPEATAAWLGPRRLAGHHHVRLDRDGDVARLARFLTGRSVGLVLGAGGARGLANIGVLRALREAGVPVDFVGGASMGGFLAALVAADFSYDEIVRFVRLVLVDRPRGFGYTLPMVAMMSVRTSEERFREIFGDRNIEDLWLNLFCVSVNITNPAMKIHRDGPVWRAVRASLAIPGLIPPLFEKGELLVDGALLNSIPVDVMHGLNAGPVIASDVGKATALAVDPELDNCPSPARLLWDSLVPGRTRHEIPRMGTILLRCMDVSSHLSKQRSQSLADLYLTPPVEAYRILDFDRAEELIQNGYQYAARVLDGLDLDAFLAGRGRDPGGRTASREIP